MHLGLVDALNIFDINYTNSKHWTNESWMNEAWKGAHLLTFKFWNATSQLAEQREERGGGARSASGEQSAVGDRA